MGRVRRPGEIVWPLSFPSSLAQSFCVQWLHETLKRLPWAKGMLWAEVRAWCVLQLSNVAVVVSLVVWVERSLESSCWEMERRFVWKLHVVGSDGAWRWWCLLQWCRWWIDGSSEDERWPDLEVTMSLCYTNCDAHESSLYVGKGVCVFFLFLVISSPPILFSLSGLPELALSWDHQLNLQYFVCSLKHLPSWLWCLRRSQNNTWLQTTVYQYHLPDFC